MRIAYKTDPSGDQDGATAPAVVPFGTSPVATEPEDPLAAFSSESESLDEPVNARPRWSRDRWIAVAALAVALIEGAFLVRAFWPGIVGTRDQGRLRIVASPDGAEVIVNDVISGPAPFELPLRAGQHKVRVRYAGVVREFTASLQPGGESTHHVDFVAPPARVSSDVAPTAGASAALDVVSDPPGARVSVDGRARGVTPLRLNDLAPGEHDVLLAGASGSVTRRVRLASATPASLVVTLPKPAGATSGWVKVQLPITAQIFQGADLLGTTDIDRLMMPAGRHTLRLINKDLRFEQQQTVDVAAGETRVVKVPLPSGLLSVNAMPWAQVWIDGEAKGETPIGNLAIPIGQHEVIFKHPQFGEQRRAVTVTLGGVTRVGVDLRR